MAVSTVEYYKRRNWFFDEELQLHVNKLLISLPDSFAVAEVGAFDFRMDKGVDLYTKFLNGRQKFFCEAAGMRFLIVPVTFTYSGSNFNANSDDPITSDHICLVYVDQLKESMILFDANDNDNQKDIVKNNLRTYLVNLLTHVAELSFSLINLLTIDDGCGLVTMFVMQCLIFDKLKWVEKFSELKSIINIFRPLKMKGKQILNNIRQQIEKVNGYPSLKLESSNEE